MTSTPDQTTRGVLLAFAAFAVFSFSDASVKLIGGKLPPYESAFFGAVFALAITPFLLNRGDRWRDIFVTADRPLWLVRFFAYPVGVIGSVTAFTYLPMAEAFILIFLQPAFITIMSVVFLKEKVGVRRWGAVAIGFIGVLVVLRPGFRELSIGHLGALFAGFSGSVSVVAFRAIGAREKHVSLFGAGILGAIVVCGLLTVPDFVAPDAIQWAELAGYGLLAAFANVLTIHAARHAPGAYIGPTQYSQMLWAILLGYLLFGDGVDLPMLAGMVLIVGSGLLTLVREKARGTPLPPSVSGERQVPAVLAPEGQPGPAS
ncbi:MAG: DMT family transporter [Parvibaculaceae bacterium]|nr:DMT family transporter [Parvibaculaceae bacterium]